MSNNGVTVTCHPSAPVRSTIQATASTSKSIPTTTNTSSSNNGLTILYFNARSIRNKLSDLEILLHTGSYDLLFVSETWLNNSNPSSSIIDTSKFDMIRNDRATHAGGVAVIYNSTFTDNIVLHNVDLSTDIGFELLIFDFYLSSRRFTRFVCLYLPPKSSSDVDIVTSLITILKKYIANQEVYIIGDFNFSEYDSKLYSTSCKGPLSQFLYFLEQHRLHQLISTPTHIHGNILDLVITSHPQNITMLDILNPFTNTCDHNMIQLNTTLKPPPSKANISPKPNFYKANYSYINSYLSNINWKALLTHDEDIETNYKKFLYIVHEAINMFVPLSKTKPKSHLPKHIKQILKSKKILYRKSKHDPSFKPQYNKKCKEYKTAVKNYKLKNELKILKSNNKKTLYNHIKNKTRSRHSVPPLKDPSGKILLSPKEKANLLNDTFAQVFLKKLPSSIPTPITKQSSISPHNFNPITRLDILQSIAKMKTSVSRTPDDIPSLFVKKTATNLLTPLHIIFNQSINTGKIPHIWKTAIVVPIYKKGKINAPTNYRPISLTSVVCRLLERIIHSQIHNHLTHNNIISPSQHGFIHKRSTQTQQIPYMHDLINFFDNKVQVDIIYLDFSKAFDKVCHTKLVYILNHYNVNSKLVLWIKNYLSNRTQQTVVNNCYSNSLPVTSGVPQGSVLGPLLFIIYLQDLLSNINNNCNNTIVYAFADDLKLLSPDPSELQHALNITNLWIKKWNLQLNAAKSEHLSLKTKSSLDFYIGNEIIPTVNNVRDLGVTLTDELSWSNYTNKIKAKATILGNIILHTFSPSNTHLLTQLYKTYIRPIVEYNTCTWSPHLDKDIKQVESVQRSFTSRLCKRGNIKYNSYNDRLKILKLETLKSRRTKFDLIMLYKIINKIVDVDFDKMFELSSLGGYALRRHSLHLNRVSSQSECHKNFFSNRVIGDWNALPENVVTSPTLSIFKRKLSLLNF